MLTKTTLYFSRDEAECILNCLCGNLLKSETGLRNTIRAQIEGLLRPRPNPNSNGWAPMGRIKPSWPSNFSKPSRVSKPRKPKKDKAPVEKITQSAQEILEGLGI
jgi:hypothetical protein